MNPQQAMAKPNPEPTVTDLSDVDPQQAFVDQFGLDTGDSGTQPSPGLGLLERGLTPQTRLISFDVFDTLLARRSGDPDAEFLFIGRRLRESGLITCSVEAFAQTRYACEKRARRNKGGREITLREVYEEVTCFTGSDQSIDAMIQIELDVEREAIDVIPAMVDVLDQARERFGKVIFVSDMYLPQAFLEDLLQSLGCMKDGDRLYLSATEGVQKGDGRLFKIVLNEEKLTPGELFHVGNSPVYDIAPAKKLGIPHYFFDQGNPHPSEGILNRFNSGSEGATALLSGAARRARLAGLHLAGDEKAIWDTGACVTGPLVYMYAQWVVSRAEQKKIKQLYFLARDAYPIYLAVQAILQDRPELNMSTRYICGSRPTYYALGIEALGEQEWEYLTSHGGHRYNTLDALCAGLMVEKETFRRHIGGAGLADVAWDASLSDDQIDALRRHALEDQAFNQDLLADLTRYQGQQRRYFEQQGLKPKDGVALVDTGWTSRSHAPLFQFLAGMGCENLRLFYVGLIVEEAYIPLDVIDTFMFNRATKQGVMSHRMVYTRALETLFTSFHGRTTRFIEEEGRVRPVFAPLEDAAFVDQYSEIYFRGFREFLEYIGPMHSAFGAMLNTREVFEQMLCRFWERPTSAEAQAWSQLTWEWDPLGQIRHALARPYRAVDAMPAFIQDRAPVLYSQFWVAAAKRLTPLHVLVAMRVAIAARRGIDRALGLIPSSIRKPITQLRRKFLSFKHH